MAQRYFTKEVLAEAEATVFASHLWDRPQLPGVTIDGVESRDLDDAIWLQERPDGVVLSVHVADVAELVTLGSSLEKTAFERTQTRYLKYGNEPMLPHVLSENRLSLREGEARPTLTVNITLDREVRIQSVEIMEAWICSLKQFSYPEVDQILQNETSAFHSFLNTCLFWADRLYQHRADPALLAEQPEGSWMDENGTWITNEGTRYHAYLIIQEFMIVANSAIAQWMADRNLTALYRNHIPKIDTDPIDLFHHLSQIGWEGALHRQLQCGLNRAEYDLQPIGHFALKRLAYCHFTSPIRRLADLINHRIIKADLRDTPLPYSIEQLEQLRGHIESVIQLQLEETKAFFKSIHQEQYEVLLDRPQSVRNLTDNEFSLLLRYAATSEQLGRIDNIVRDRIVMHQLTVEDWFVLLFLSQVQKLQDKVLAQLECSVHHAPSIIAIAQNQIENWGAIDYRTQGGTSPFQAWLEVEIEGEYWTTNMGGIHARKQGAKHHACLVWLTAYCNNQLVHSDFSLISPVTNVTEEMMDSRLTLNSEVNAISQLNELCQKYQWADPDYVFYDEELEGFMCECEIEVSGETILGFGSGSRKAIAKKQAAQQVLEQIHAVQNGAKKQL